MRFGVDSQRRVHTLFKRVTLSLEPRQHVGVNFDNDGYGLGYTEGGSFEKVVAQLWSVAHINLFVGHVV